MRTKLSLELSEDTAAALEVLCEFTGFPREYAAQYAVRLVSACIREGLIEDTPRGAWPEEARPLYDTDDGKKVLSFPGGK